MVIVVTSLKHALVARRLDALGYEAITRVLMLRLGVVARPLPLVAGRPL